MAPGGDFDNPDTDMGSSSRGTGCRFCLFNYGRPGKPPRHHRDSGHEPFFPCAFSFFSTPKPRPRPLQPRRRKTLATHKRRRSVVVGISQPAAPSSVAPTLGPGPQLPGDEGVRLWTFDLRAGHVRRRPCLQPQVHGVSEQPRTALGSSRRRNPACEDVRERACVSRKASLWALNHENS